MADGGDNNPAAPGQPDAVSNAEVKDMLMELRSQFVELKDNFQDAKDAMMVKRSRPNVEFRKKGNEVQYNLNSDAIDNMSLAIGYANAGKADKVCTVLNSTIDDFEHRNKCIIIADQSDYGWDAVGHYLKPDVSTNEADGKRIYHANLAAKRERERKRIYEDFGPRGRMYRRNRGSGRRGYNNADGYNSGYNNNFSSNNMQFPGALMPGFGQFLPQFGQPMQQALPPFFMPNNLPMFQPQMQQPSYSQSKDGPTCFYCQQTGHMQGSCPSKKAGYPPTAPAGKR